MVILSLVGFKTTTGNICLFQGLKQIEDIVER